MVVAGPAHLYSFVPFVKQCQRQSCCCTGCLPGKGLMWLALYPVVLSSGVMFLSIYVHKGYCGSATQSLPSTAGQCRLRWLNTAVRVSTYLRYKYPLDCCFICSKCGTFSNQTVGLLELMCMGFYHRGTGRWHQFRAWER